MQIIVIAAQKGGAGKTTLALHLAVEYQRAGKSVALIDTDPQRSAEMWGGLRDAQDITVVGVPGAEIAAALRDAESDGYDVVLVDTPPHASAALVPVLRLATLAVVPFQPSPWTSARWKPCAGCWTPPARRPWPSSMPHRYGQPRLNPCVRPSRKAGCRCLRPSYTT